jgi:long-chain fatty acid transport protein
LVRRGLTGSKVNAMKNGQVYLPLAFFVLLGTWLLSGPAHGSGFAIFTQGASSLGQAAATVAHNDDPSAIFFNPALITHLPGSQIEVGTTLVYPSRKFTSAADGTEVEGESRTFFPSTAYFKTAVNEKVHLGLGIFSPFGLGTRWPDDWEGRYLATNSEIKSLAVNPVVAWQVLPNVSVAAGINVLWLDATLERKIPTTLIASQLTSAGLLPDMGTLPDSGQKFSGDGTGIGYNLGLHIDLHERLSLGLSYRSTISVDIYGQTTFSEVPFFLGELFPATGAQTKITLPQQVFAGLGYRVSERLVIETGVRWEGWSSFRELAISFEEPVVGESVLREPRNWRDTYAVNVGGKYQVTDRTSFLAGYLYGQNPIPGHTFEPSVPDADSHLFCIGTEVKFTKVKLALSYAYQKLENRGKNNMVGAGIGAAANGKYESNLQLASIGMTYAF